MNVSRSGYYKWLKNKDILNQYEIDRIELGKLIQDIVKDNNEYIASYVLNYKTPIEYRTQLGFN